VVWRRPKYGLCNQNVVTVDVQKVNGSLPHCLRHCLHTCIYIACSRPTSRSRTTTSFQVPPAKTSTGQHCTSLFHVIHLSAKVTENHKKTTTAADDLFNMVRPGSICWTQCHRTRYKWAWNVFFRNLNVLCTLSALAKLVQKCELSAYNTHALGCRKCCKQTPKEQRVFPSRYSSWMALWSRKRRVNICEDEKKSCWSTRGRWASGV